LKAVRSLFLIFCVVNLTLAGCRNGKIPCPKFGGGKKLALFNRNASAANGAPLGEKVQYGKNGLLKKNKYKYLRNKPKRKKYKNK